jgi:aspartate/methionine/tyrosine aminotransferase
MQIAPFKLERYFARYEFSARYLLCSSDCESLTIADLLALEPGAEDGLKRHWLGYTESLGAPSLRQEIACIYETIAPEHVLVHSGAQEAITIFMQATIQPGDHLIVHWPCYQSLFEIAKSLGAEISYWEARPENGWALDFDELERLIRPDTRLIVVNTPHNPTGWLISRAEQARLELVCRERDILLFSDEVYRELEHDPLDRLPAACDLNPNFISLGVMSKTYGLAGLRIGWIATRNTHIYQKMAALKDYTTICNSAPSEFLAELALRHRQKLAARNLDIIHYNLALLDDFFSRHSDRFSWVRPTAGPIAFPKLLKGDVETFCDELVHESGVLLLPGAMYDHPGNHFRLGFARKNMPEALARLEEFLNINDGR